MYPTDPFGPDSLSHMDLGEFMVDGDLAFLGTFFNQPL